MASERVYTSQHPLIKQKLAILRDKTTLPVVFRRTVSEIATLLAVEATTDLRLEAYPVTTPLAQTTGKRSRNASHSCQFCVLDWVWSRVSGS